VKVGDSVYQGYFDPSTRLATTERYQVCFSAKLELIPFHCLAHDDFQVIPYDLVRLPLFARVPDLYQHGGCHLRLNH